MTISLMVATAQTLIRPGTRLLGAGLLCVALGACSRTPDTPTPGKDATTKAVPVVVATVLQKTLPQRIRAIGNVEPLAAVSVKSRVEGQITRVYLKDGQEVAQGEPLFEIDPRPFQAQLQQAEATLRKDEAQLRYLHWQAENYRALLQKEYITREAYAQVTANRDAAAATLRVDQAAIDNARLQLGFTTIRAPIAGRAGRIMATAGNLVKANDTPELVVINQLSPIYASFAVPEQEGDAIRALLARGSLPVQAQPRARAAAPVTGRLAFVDNTVDPTTGTLKLRAEFANADHALWPGDFVDIVLTVREQADAVVVPSQAIQNGPQGPYVYVVQPDLKAVMRTVNIARAEGDETVIAAGLRPGERVVTDGASRLVPDARVQIKNATAAQ